jgi:hypothetical protein
MIATPGAMAGAHGFDPPPGSARDVGPGAYGAQHGKDDPVSSPSTRPARTTALRARADRLSGIQRRALLAAAAALLGLAAVLAVFRSECTRTTREEVRDRASTSTPQRVLVEEIRCAPPTISSAPSLALVLLAGLALSPWITRLTVGSVGLDTSTTPVPGSPEGTAQALASPQAPSAGSGSLVDSARARIAEVFVEGADLPRPWDRATLLFASPTLAGPALIFAKGAPGEVTDAARHRRLLEVATPALNAAVLDAGEVKAAHDAGLMTLAAAGTNLEGRPVSLVAAVLSSAPAGPVPSDVAVDLVDLADSWARVMIDVLLLEDDS